MAIKIYSQNTEGNTGRRKTKHWWEKQRKTSSEVEVVYKKGWHNQ